MGIGQRLKYARERAGLTLEQVRGRTDVGVSSLSEFENDKREPRMSQLQSLARLYRRTVAFFLGDEPIREDVVLWRQQPESPAAEEIEGEFRRLCEQYHNLEVWCRERRPCRLPSAERDAGELDYAEAENLAHKVRSEFQLGEHPGALLLRVLEEVCGIKVFHLVFEPTGAAACTVSRDFGPAILLNARNVRWRRNFDVAHELFHILAWEVLREDQDSASRVASDRVESLANAFAANLLMPTEAVHVSVNRKARSGKLRTEDFFDLAREFDVSADAMVCRVAFVYRWDGDRTAELRRKCRSLAAACEERADGRHDAPARPERFQALALKALRMGEISIGRFAEYVGISRSKAFRYAEQEAVDDEEIEIVPA